MNSSRSATHKGAPTQPVSAAIYCRISRDKEGAGLGVDRQEADCRALAKRLGWRVATVYVDNDISAYSGASRPQYRAMLEAVRSGQVRAVLAWHPDRLHRRMAELEEFIHLLDLNSVEVRTVTAGDLDLSSPTGRMNARIVGAVAQKEVEQTKDRVRAAKEQAAAAGKYRGGPRPYGYEADGLTVREDEAAVIREATAAVLGGRSLRSVADELSARGLKPNRMVRKRDEDGAVVRGEYEPKVRLNKATGEPKKDDWTYATLRDVLIRPRNAGLLHTGRVDRGAGAFAIVGRARWPAIVDEETWRAVHALLTDSSRRMQEGNALRWLGSGIYRCGRCGSSLRVTALGETPSRSGRPRTYHYRCEATAHLTVHQEKTDAYVLDVVADLVRDPRVQAAMAPRSDDSALAADRERRTVVVTNLQRFESDYSDSIITGAQLQKATAKATAELADLDARITEAMRQSTASPILSAFDPGAALLAAPVDVQRAVLRAVLSVRVLPSAGGGKWSSERLLLTPVGGEQAA